jgi:hypothetical protein
MGQNSGRYSSMEMAERQLITGQRSFWEEYLLPLAPFRTKGIKKCCPLEH